MVQSPTILVHLTALAVVSDCALDTHHHPQSPPASSLLPSDLTATKTKCVFPSFDSDTCFQGSSLKSVSLCPAVPQLICYAPADMPRPNSCESRPAHLGPLATTTLFINSSSASSWVWTLLRGR